ncbi:PAS domain-containing protein [Mesorhizobium sp. M0991]
MAMVFTDAKHENPIIFVNDAFLELTGYSREEVLGQSFNFLMARGTDPDSLARIEAAFAGNAVGGSEISYRRKDGSLFWSAPRGIMTNQPRGGLGLCPRMVMAVPVHSARGPQLGNNEAADKVFKGIQLRTQSREDHSVAERHFAEVDRIVRGY